MRGRPVTWAVIQRYGVARDTARRAVKLLREQGYVETIPHRGTFVLVRDEVDAPK
ncbi:GntR family transcriptional regulator [Streptomyces sp. SID3343]|nr:GntR family transcriptional regulator [Streptomyces sp. SID3343]